MRVKSRKSEWTLLPATFIVCPAKSQSRSSLETQCWVRVCFKYKHLTVTLKCVEVALRRRRDHMSVLWEKEKASSCCNDHDYMQKSEQWTPVSLKTTERHIHTTFPLIYDDPITITGYLSLLLLASQSPFLFLHCLFFSLIQESLLIRWQ